MGLNRRGRRRGSEQRVRVGSAGEWMRKERVWVQGWEYQLHKAERVKIDNRPEQ